MAGNTIIRGGRGGLGLRATGLPDGEPLRTMYSHLAVLDSWTEIDSWAEGNFMERISPGSFAFTIAIDRDRLRVLLEHGKDPTVGNKLLGVPLVLREDEVGAYSEVGLFDTSYVRDLIPGLEAGQYGPVVPPSRDARAVDSRAQAIGLQPEGSARTDHQGSQDVRVRPDTVPGLRGDRRGPAQPHRPVPRGGCLMYRSPSTAGDLQRGSGPTRWGRTSRGAGVQASAPQLNLGRCWRKLKRWRCPQAVSPTVGRRKRGSPPFRKRARSGGFSLRTR